jgi:hypothetical protein
MLPILRILPVGGVFLAITILVLALSPPGGTRRELPAGVLLARGALMKQDEHPEWRQLLLLAAFQRADELSRLRELPDTPVRSDSGPPAATTSVEAVTANPMGKVEDNGEVKVEIPVADKVPTDADKAPEKVAGLPATRNEAEPDPEDITGTIPDLPIATMPLEIGETSSTELFVVPHEEKPPVIKLPPKRAQKPPVRKPKAVHRIRRAKSPAKPAAAKPRVAARTIKPQTAAQPNFFEAIFGTPQSQQPTASGAQASQPTEGR